MQRTSKGQFAPGKSGNPKGKSTGSRNRATLAAEALIEGEGKKLARKAIELALEGHPVALRLCIERLLPPRRERAVQLKLPAILGLADHPGALSEIARATAAGEIVPSEGVALSGILECHRRSLETAELAQRLARIEERLGYDR